MEEYLKELAHYAKEKFLRGKVDDVIIYVFQNDSGQIKFVNNKVAKTSVESAANMEIFFAKDKRVIKTTVKDVGGKSVDGINFMNVNVAKCKIDGVVKSSLKFVKYVKPKDDYYGIAKGPFKYKKSIDTYDPKLMNLGEKQVDLTYEGINAALKAGAKRCSGICETHFAETFFLTSGGAEVGDRGTSLYFSIRALLDGEASGHMNCAERLLRNADVRGAGEFAGTVAKSARNPISGRAGKYDIIFAPLAFGVFLDHIGNATSMFDVDAGISFFNDKLNKKVAGSHVNIYDDATLPGGLNSSSFDAEGVPTQKTVLVDKGELKNYLFNTSLARKYKTKTTGNAGITAPSPWNIVLAPGDLNKDELFREAKDALYVTNVWYTRFQNMVTGEFSTVPRDGIFLIKDGELAKSLKGIRIHDSMLNILKNIRLIANDSKQMYSWEINTPAITPHVLVRNVGVTKPTK